MNSHAKLEPHIATPDYVEHLERENRRLTELFQTATQFVDHVSHEFRTPLTVIKDSCALVHDGLLGPVTHEQREYLQTTLTRIDDLACLVDDMLDISRVEAGQIGLWRQSCDTAAIVADVEKLIARRAAARGITVEVQLADNLPRLYCDPENIRRVLTNLLINAVKFSHSASRITIWARPDDEAGLVRLGVTDRGAGIRPERLKLLFERFQQAGRHARSNASLKGFGLGLSIARELVHLNLGTIHVASPPGEGATFSFTVPVDDPAGVFERYLDRCSRTRESSDRSLTTSATANAINVFLVTVREPLTDVVAHEIDEFLHSSSRATDIVFRRPHGWLLVTDRPAQQLDEFTSQLVREWNSLNDNRPKGKLPSLSFRMLGTWNTDTDRDELPRQFQLALQPPSPPVRESLPRTSPQILLVDDEEDVLRAVSVRLRAAGYQVIAAQDGREGMAAAIEHHPDAIVLDVCMPDMDGFSMLDKLRNHAGTTEIPVVMLSASVRDQQQALQHGARFFIHKPYDSKNLLTAIQTTIGAKP